MPNHCLQQTAIRGPKESRDRFISLAIDEGYPSLKVLHPMPEELRDTFVGFTSDEELAKARAEKHASLRLKYGHGDWYSWAHAEWGTKWGDYETNIINHDVWGTSIEFQSAWGPSSELVGHISALFPDLLFVTTITEESHAFAGFTIHKGGKTLEDVETHIPPYDWEADGEDDEKRYEWEEAYVIEMQQLADEATARWLATA